MERLLVLNDFDIIDALRWNKNLYLMCQCGSLRKKGKTRICENRKYFPFAYRAVEFPDEKFSRERIRIFLMAILNRFSLREIYSWKFPITMFIDILRRPEGNSISIFTVKSRCSHSINKNCFSDNNMKYFMSEILQRVVMKFDTWENWKSIVHGLLMFHEGFFLKRKFICFILKILLTLRKFIENPYIGVWKLMQDLS